LLKNSNPFAYYNLYLFGSIKDIYFPLNDKTKQKEREAILNEMLLTIKKLDNEYIMERLMDLSKTLERFDKTISKIK